MESVSTGSFPPRRSGSAACAQQQEGGLSDNERTLNKEPEQKQPPKSKDLAAEREQQRSQGRGGYYR